MVGKNIPNKIRTPFIAALVMLCLSATALQFSSCNVVPSTTVLIANSMNANLGSRVYLWNPSASAGNVTARVFTIQGAGPSTVLATVNLGSLEASSALIFRLAEDILTPAGIPLPYTGDNGNVALELTIEATNVTGLGQVSFGPYPLQSGQ